MTTIFTFALLCAIVSLTFGRILTEEDGLLERYRERIKKQFDNDSDFWVTKLFGDCTMCFAGQLAFWAGLPFWYGQDAFILAYTLLFWLLFLTVSYLLRSRRISFALFTVHAAAAAYALGFGFVPFLASVFVSIFLARCLEWLYINFLFTAQ